MAIKGSTFFRATALASAVVVAGTSIALGEGDTPDDAPEIVEVTPEFTSAVACVAPSDILEVDARTQDSDAYRLSIDPSGITADTFAGLSNDELGFLKEDIVAQVVDNAALATGPIADNLFASGGSYIKSYARGNHILSESPDAFNPDRERRNLGAIGETIQNFAAGMDTDILSDADALAAERDRYTERVEATRDRIISQVGAAFDGITEARAAEVEALVAETPEGGEVSFCPTGLDQPVAE